MNIVNAAENPVKMHIYGKVRKYPEDCLRLGFFWSGDEKNQTLLCILCFHMLVNEPMKPAKRSCHLETKHKGAVGK